jgi:hypothetical protein
MTSPSSRLALSWTLCLLAASAAHAGTLQLRVSSCA